MDVLTHAVTVPQPLAWPLAAGHCPVIMSDTRPGLEHEGKLIGIHASNQRADEYRGLGPRSAVVEMLRRGNVDVLMPEIPALHRGALIGVARLVSIVQRDRFDRFDQQRFVRMSGKSVGTRLSAEDGARIRPWWRSGSKWGLLLADACEIEPIPMRGAGGVWRIPAQARLDGREIVGWSEPSASALEQWRKARGA